MKKPEPITIDTKQISEAFALVATTIQRHAQALVDLVKSPEFQDFMAKNYPPAESIASPTLPPEGSQLG